MHAENGWVKRKTRARERPTPLTHSADVPAISRRWSGALLEGAESPVSHHNVPSSLYQQVFPLPHLIIYGIHPLSGSKVISARGAADHKASSCPLIHVLYPQRSQLALGK